MRGIHVTRYGGAEVLQYLDLPDPVPESDQVLIKVKGASVNFADTKARTGNYHLGKKPPYIPGIDAAGIVLDVDQNVKDIKIGEKFPLEQAAVAHRHIDERKAIGKVLLIPEKSCYVMS